MHMHIDTHVSNVEHKAHARMENVKRKLLLHVNPVMLHGASHHF